MSEQEYLHMKPAADTAKCWAHNMPSEGLAKKLVYEMRRMHDKGGVDVCRECCLRARAVLPQRTP